MCKMEDENVFISQSYISRKDRESVQDFVYRIVIRHRC